MTIEQNFSPTEFYLEHDALSLEIAAKARPVDYAELLGDKSVLVLGELHDNFRVRDHLASQASYLRELGVTHYAIEAFFQSEIEDLNNGLPVDFEFVSLAHYKYRKLGYETAVRAMAGEGIRIEPIDYARPIESPYHVREQHIVKNMLNILEENPDAKVIALMGAKHADKTDDKYFMTQALIDLGVSVNAAQFVGGVLPGRAKWLTDASQQADLHQTDYMIDMDGFENHLDLINTTDSKSTDYIIHLAQQQEA